jgi:pyridoxal phosphate-dependent aminotransferase EpsN
MGGEELKLVQEAFATNWIAPLGPQVDAFEKEFAAAVGSPYAAALSSGTAALHLALRMIRLGAVAEVADLGGLPNPNKEPRSTTAATEARTVFCSSLTFSASANPIVYEGLRPVFIDCERKSWNMDPDLLEKALKEADQDGHLPLAVILVHLYGQSADINAIAGLCARYGVPLIEDAAEALGAEYYGSDGVATVCAQRTTEVPLSGTTDAASRLQSAPGAHGLFGIYSFNGNKIITTSGGGMLVSADKVLIEKARFLATQARDPAPHYQHSEIGYNYRLSNVLAAIGRGQLRVLPERVNARRAVCARYQTAFGNLPGIEFMPEAPWGRCTRWLTCVTIDPAKSGTDTESLRLALAEDNIEARPVWKPMHLQPVFQDCQSYVNGVSEDLFDRGLCLPSGSNMSIEDQDRVIAIIRAKAR